MYYQTPGYGYSYGCMPMYNPCYNKRQGNGYALILVLFILLVIIGAARW
ncbi:TPA: YjcZ family sporulation protein [Candidatus Avacholeplasma faecigallinarum]|nr:YjcZ family sporulation protein [Candidatus Avacholeplasma faecigallinarum]